MKYITVTIYYPGDNDDFIIGYTAFEGPQAIEGTFGRIVQVDGYLVLIENYRPKKVFRSFSELIEFIKKETGIEAEITTIKK